MPFFSRHPGTLANNYPSPDQFSCTTTPVTVAPPIYTYFISASAANNISNLPGATLSANQRAYIFKEPDSSANTIRLTPVSSQTIDGASTYVLSSQHAFVAIRSHGSNCQIV
jgi:hypothetical protein